MKRNRLSLLRVLSREPTQLSTCATSAKRRQFPFNRPEADKTSAPHRRNRTAAEAPSESDFIFKDPKGPFSSKPWQQSKMTVAQRRQRMRELLDDAPRRSVEEPIEGVAASSVEFTTGGEAESRKHSSGDDTMSIPTDSAMYHQFFGEGDGMRSRKVSTWSLVNGTAKRSEGGNDGNAVVYRTSLDRDASLEHADFMVQNSKSIYTHETLQLDGLYAVSSFISMEEERAAAEEVMALTQRPSSAFIADEGRYCANCFSAGVRIGQRDPIAHALDDTPTLKRIGERAAAIGLLPCPPNTFQLSEFVTPYGGIPLQRRHPSLGPYLAVLSLISPSLLYFSHVSMPWAPRYYADARSLLIVKGTCLREYKMGTRTPQEPFHTFRFHTRHSVDYRMEVMFASVEPSSHRWLSVATEMQDYYEKRLASLPRLQDSFATESETSKSHVARLHNDMSEGQERGKDIMASAMIKQAVEGTCGSLSGAAVKEVLQREKEVGRPIATGTAASRVARLKAKMEARHKEQKEASLRRFGVTNVL